MIKQSSNLHKVLGYLEDSEGKITTFTPNNPPHGVRDSKGNRPPFMTIIYNGCKGELTKEEISRTQEFIFSDMLNALARYPVRYNTMIKPLWFQNLLTK